MAIKSYISLNEEVNEEHSNIDEYMKKCIHLTALKFIFTIFHNGKNFFKSIEKQTNLGTPKHNKFTRKVTWVIQI